MSREGGELLKTYLFSLSIFLCSLGATQYIAYQQLGMLKAREKEIRTNETHVIKSQIESAFKFSIATTSTLAFIIKHQGIPDNFNDLAASMIQGGNYIDAIEILDSGVITHVYPLESNKSILGYDILKDPNRSKEALTAIRMKSLFFAGPLELKQGGKAIIGRLPMFKNERFIGFVAVIINLNTLIKASGIQNGNSNYRYKLAKRNANTGEEEFFLPGENINMEKEYSQLPIQEGAFKIYVQNRFPVVWLNVVWASFFGLLVSLLCAFIAFRLFGEPSRLQYLVTQKIAQLQNERGKFKFVFDNSPFGKALIHLENKEVLDSNDKFGRLLGLEKSQLSQLWSFAFFPTENPNHTYSKEISYKNTNGSWRWLNMTISPLMDIESGFTHFCTIFDITDEKQLHLNVENAFHERNKILESIGDAFFSLDTQLTITYWNKQAEKLLLHNRDDVLGKKLTDVLGEFIDVRLLETYNSDLSLVEPVHFKQHIARLDKWFEVSVYPFQSGNAVYFSDITDSVKHLSEINHQNEKLKEIAWIQSHIVRGPLARIMGIIQLLEMQEVSDDERVKLHKQLLIVAHELDRVLYEIVEKANQIEKELHLDE